MDFLTIIKTDWHKIIVVILALVQMWKFSNKRIRTIIGKEEDKLPQSMNIMLPPEGCTITIKPLEKVDKV
jgi:hypothetical protein